MIKASITVAVIQQESASVALEKNGGLRQRVEQAVFAPAPRAVMHVIEIDGVGIVSDKRFTSGNPAVFALFQAGRQCSTVPHEPLLQLFHQLDPAPTTIGHRVPGQLRLIIVVPHLTGAGNAAGHENAVHKIEIITQPQRTLLVDPFMVCGYRRRNGRRRFRRIISHRRKRTAQAERHRHHPCSACCFHDITLTRGESYVTASSRSTGAGTSRSGR